MDTKESRELQELQESILTATEQALERLRDARVGPTREEPEPSRPQAGAER